MKKEIVSIYENIYNQEINWKNNLDNKFASRLTLMLALITATFILFTTIFFQKEDNKAIENANSIVLLYKALSVITVVFVICILFSFHKCFFRTKLNYRVMPTFDIRIFHFYIYSNNLLGTNDENDLYNYLNDSYQFCAYTNAEINIKREKALLVFDNLSSITFVILIIVYILMTYCGYSINWIF